ncbi:hypothetical protein [Bacillus sp. T33-2]|uniref:hypothetical protein n=1 Tax=Bacillus sp. T33-2 TaxID=2054168 RepID=UPI000C7841EB|nr:hypothetical protein [Bacillus sp. T33-2]PLR95739.1 hypothetical protein CVD19_13450 [Bacillus sp. T33-2]
MSVTLDNIYSFLDEENKNLLKSILTISKVNGYEIVEVEGRAIDLRKDGNNPCFSLILKETDGLISFCVYKNKEYMMINADVDVIAEYDDEGYKQGLHMIASHFAPNRI